MLYMNVAGNEYINFKAVKVTKSLGSISSSFSFEVSLGDVMEFKDSKDGKPAEIKLSRIKKGDVVQVFAADLVEETSPQTTPTKIPLTRYSKKNISLLLTGYITRISINYDKGGRTYVFSGYNLLQDLVASSLPSANIQDTFKTVKTYPKLVETVLGLLGINVDVINRSDDQSLSLGSLELKPSRGEKCFAFLEKIGRKLQVFLKSDVDGNLVILSGADTSVSITNKLANSFYYREGDENAVANNILSGSYSINDEDLFNTYLGRANLNPSNIDIAEISKITGADTNLDGMTSPTYTLTDDTIRSTRHFEFVGEADIDPQKLEQRVTWEKNRRDALSETYSCKILGHIFKGQLLDVGYLIELFDETCGIEKKLIISQLTFDYDMTSGSTTSLTLANEDAFKVLDVSKKKKSKDTSFLSDVHKITSVTAK